MTPHFIGKRNALAGIFAMAIMALLTSCTATPGGTTCSKCIDTKPTPTAFHSTLNEINHVITVDQGSAMVNDFMANQDSLLAPEYRGRGTLPVYETFNLKAIDSIICQKNTVGFRVYLSMDKQKKVRFVLVGVDGDGKDYIQRRRSGERIGAGGSILVEESGQRWP
ncbi:MAG: hypothetical protein EOP51_13280 [Sphingobacteriales bacterium]|nr:MAG: hypothetical protein EOP51_13280 [Sphingobacteriales bacterium]